MTRVRPPCAYAVCVRWITLPASCRAHSRASLGYDRAHGLRAFTVMICGPLARRCASMQPRREGLRQSWWSNRPSKRSGTPWQEGHQKAAFSVDDAMLVDIRLQMARRCSSATPRADCLLRRRSKSAWTEAAHLTSEPQQALPLLAGCGCGTETCVDWGHDQV